MVPLILTCDWAGVEELLDLLLEDKLLLENELLLEDELILEDELLLEDKLLLEEELLLEDELLLEELLVIADDENLGVLEAVLLEPPSEPPPQATIPKLSKTATESRITQEKPFINASNFLGV